MNATSCLRPSAYNRIAPLGARMGAVVHAPEPLAVDVAIDLGRRERGVPEQFLDDTEVGAALEQVRRERVPEPVGVRREPAECARVQAPSARGEEDGVLSVSRKEWPGVAQVAT